MMQQATQRLAVAAQLGAADAIGSFDRRLEAARSARAPQQLFQWVWVVLIGVLVLAAGAGFVYCRARGYDGFSGNVEAYKGPLGVKIGIKIGCY